MSLLTPSELSSPRSDRQSCRSCDDRWAAPASHKAEVFGAGSLGYDPAWTFRIIGCRGPVRGPTLLPVPSSIELLDEAVLAGADEFIDYRLAAPKWQFLCYAADRGGFVLHGTGNPDIAMFEPRQSNDVDDFGNRCAVYAASDGLWPMYFAIFDRDRYPMGLTNACIRLVGVEGAYYFFSISRSALDQQPWRDGIVYLLPADTFETQKSIMEGDHEIQIAQVASLTPVRPIAKLRVGPEDFPFLHAIRGHDNAVISARAAADPAGFPWVDSSD